MEKMRRSGEGSVAQRSLPLPTTLDVVHLKHLFSSMSGIQPHIQDGLQSLGILKTSGKETLVSQDRSR